MAAPAAVLAVLVTANTKQANAALAKTQGQLAATTKTATVTSAAMRRLGTAAKYGGLLLAGGLAVGLKKSVDEAREANKVMAQTDAVIKSTGGAAQVTAKHVSTLSERLSEKAGVDDEAIQSGANLLLTFKAIRNEVGEGNKIFDQATSVALDMSAALGQDMKSSAIQLGKALNDPTVGLTALRRVGVSFNDQQSEQILKLQESGNLLQAQKKILAELTSEFRGSAKAQADAGDRLRVVFDNIAEDVGMKVVPALEEMATKVSDVLSNKGLTGDEKADRLAKYFTKLFSKGLDALEAAAPHIAEAGGRMALRLIRGFAEAWWNADVIGKLFLAGTFIRLLGGKGALTALGAALGRPIGTAMGRAYGAAFAAGMILLILQNKDAIAKAVDDVLPDVDLGPVSDVIADVDPGFKPKVQGNLIGGDVKGVLAQREDVIRDHVAKVKGINKSLWDDLRGITGKGQGEVGRITIQGLDKQGDKFKDTRAKLDATTRGQAGDVAGNTNRMVDAVGQGLKTLGSNTNKALSAFGAKKVQFAVESVGASVAKGMGKQQGGIVVPGSGSGDKVPLQAMVEPGEGVFVLNRNAMGAMQAFNDRFPRFAKGGIVGLGNQLVNKGYLVGEHPAFGGVAPVHTPGSYHYSGQALDVNWSPVSQEPGKLDSLYGKLKNMPGVIELLWRVANHFDHLHVAMAQGANANLAFGGNVRLDKLALGGPDGPLRSMGQGALDTAWKAARKFIDGKKGAMAAMSHPSSSGSMSKGQIAKLWNSVNPGLGNANLMAAIAMAESSGNPAANGPPDGRGLWQIEWPIWSATLGKYGNPFNPAANAKMAGQVLKQQGLGAWVVYNTGAYQQFLQKGGALPYAGSFGKGGIVPGPVGKPFTATVHGGEEITPRTGAQWERAWKASAEADRERDKEVRDLIRQFVKNQETIMRSGRQKDNAINAAIAAAASGQIGGKVQLESNTPTPGRLASY